MDELDLNRKRCLRYEEIICSYNGERKTDKWGLSAAKNIPVSIVLFDKVIAYNINPYKVITSQLAHRFRT